MQLLLLLACTGQQDWTTPADCEGVSPQATQDQCLSDVSVLVAKSDLAGGGDLSGAEALIQQIEDPLIQDYAWHQLTRDVAPESYTYCNKIQNERLVQRCKSIVSRPHLHEHLKDGDVPDAGPRGKGPPPSGPEGGPEGGPIKPPPPGSKPPPPGATVEGQGGEHPEPPPQ